MSDRRDYGRMSSDMRDALDQYSREEIADLLTHIVRVFVIESGGAVDVQPAAAAGMEDLRSLTFGQLMLHLQMNLPHEELKRFHISGASVWLEHNGAEIPVAGHGAEWPAEQPPDADIIDPPHAQGASLQMDVSPTPFGRDDFPQMEPTPSPLGPSSTVADLGQIERPDVGLRNQPVPEPSFPIERGGGPGSDAPGRRKKKSKDEANDDIGDVSDRFSMLELD